MNLYIIIIALLLFFIIVKNNNNNTENFNNKYKLCVMAIFKNEEEYLEEWIQHHINQGISHFYLYCNDEKIEKYNYLNKYEKYITLIQWINKVNKGSETIQRQAYTHCIQNYNNEYEYIMMLDIDEFIVHQEKEKKVIDFINNIDKKTKAIKVQRYNFGSDGHIKKPNGKVVDNYKKHENICSSYKTIANSNYIDINKKFYGVHDFNFINKEGKIYNEYFSYKYTGFPNGCDLESINEIPLVINHYYTKSYDEYIKRCEMWKNGGVNTVGYREKCEELFSEKDIK